MMKCIYPYFNVHKNVINKFECMINSSFVHKNDPIHKRRKQFERRGGG